MTQAKVLVFAGSTREASLNKKLAKTAAKAAEAQGAQVTYLDLRDYPMPLYDQDFEDQSGLPEEAKDLKAMFMDHNALIIASPEYNSSYSAVLKNAIDWISRKEGDEAPLVAFTGKTALIMSASPSPMGGLRGLLQLRALLGNIKVLVLPEQLTVASAFEAFDEKGGLQDNGLRKRLEQAVKHLVNLSTQLA